MLKGIRASALLLIMATVPPGLLAQEPVIHAPSPQVTAGWDVSKPHLPVGPVRLGESDRFPGAWAMGTLGSVAGFLAGMSLESWQGMVVFSSVMSGVLAEAAASSEPRRPSQYLFPILGGAGGLALGVVLSSAIDIDDDTLAIHLLALPVFQGLGAALLAVVTK